MAIYWQYYRIFWRRALNRGGGKLYWPKTWSTFDYSLDLEFVQMLLNSSAPQTEWISTHLYIESIVRYEINVSDDFVEKAPLMVSRGSPSEHKIVQFDCKFRLLFDVKFSVYLISSRCQIFIFGCQVYIKFMSFFWKIGEDCVQVLQTFCGLFSFWIDFQMF